jgi:hypothetical protein
MINLKTLSRVFTGLALLSALALFATLASSQVQAAGTSDVATDDMVFLSATGVFDGFGLEGMWQASIPARPIRYPIIKFDVDTMYATGGLTGAITQARFQIAGGGDPAGADIPIALHVLDDVAPWSTWTEASPPPMGNISTAGTLEGAFLMGDTTQVDTPEEGNYINGTPAVYNFLDNGGALVAALEARRSANGGSGFVTFIVAPTGNLDGQAACFDDVEGNSEGLGCTDLSALFSAGPRLHIADATGPLAVTLSDAGATTSNVSSTLILVLFAMLLTFSAAAIMVRRMKGNEELS